MNFPAFTNPDEDPLPTKVVSIHRSTSAGLAAWIILGIVALFSTAQAQNILLGAAEDFAVLGGSTVTNTGPTIITGDVGVSPGTAITGFPPGVVVGGTIRSNDAVAQQAQVDARAAFNLLANEPFDLNLSGQNLGGMTLLPGVYRFDTNAALTGTLNLDTLGDPDAVFHFQIGTELTTADNSSILLPNGGSNNIFWQIGSSATLGTNSLFVGTIIADQSITLTTGATLDGRALALDGAVTLDSNSIGFGVLGMALGRFWTGEESNLWSGVNWSPNASGTGASFTLAPGADVVFSATGAQNQNTVLDVDTTISSLTINDPTAVTISGPGVLSIVGGGTETGITVNSGAGLATINSDLALSGDQVTTVHNAAGLIINGAVSGADGFTKAGAGDLVLTGVNTYVGDTTILAGSLGVDGSVVGNVIVSGGTLRGSGTIGGSVLNQALVQPGGATAPGTLTIGGNFNQSPAGTLSIRLASPTSYDLLTIGGAAFLSGALNVSYLDGFNAQIGDVFTILTAAGGVSGTFDSFNDAHATGTLLGLEVVYQDNAVLLRFVQGSFVDNLPGLPPNELQVAQALDRLAADQPDNELIEELNALQLAQLPGALSLLSPEDFAAIFTSGFAISEVQVGNLERRLGEVRQGASGFSDSGYAVTDSHGARHYDGKSTMSLDGKSSVSFEDKEIKEFVETAVEREHRWGFFISGTGEIGDLESTSSARGSDFTTGGVTVGADYRVNRHLVLGAALGYANTSADLSRGGDLEIDSGKASLYATLYGGGFYLNGIVGAGRGSIDTKRRTLGGFARGQTNATDFNGLLGTGYDFHHGAFTWGPVASLQYTTVGIDGFTERGALGALRINEQSQDSLKSAVGLKASYRQRIGRVVLTPEIRAQWQHEYLDRASSIDAGFSSRNSFTVQGPETGRDALLLDAGLSAQLTPHVAVFAYYTGELGRENYTVHSINGGVRVSF